VRYFGARLSAACGNVLGLGRVASGLGLRSVAARYKAYRCGVRWRLAAAAACETGSGAALAVAPGTGGRRGVARGVAILRRTSRLGSPLRRLGIATRGVAPGTAAGGCTPHGVSLRRALDAGREGSGAAFDVAPGTGGRGGGARSPLFVRYFGARLSAAWGNVLGSRPGVSVRRTRAAAARYKAYRFSVRPGQVAAAAGGAGSGAALDVAPGTGGWGGGARSPLFVRYCGARLPAAWGNGLGSRRVASVRRTRSAAARYKAYRFSVRLGQVAAAAGGGGSGAAFGAAPGTGNRRGGTRGLAFRRGTLGLGLPPRVRAPGARDV
jgi:hypothetical protein